MISLNSGALKAAAIVGVVLLSAGCDKKLEDDKPNFDNNLIHYFPFSGNGVDEVTGQEFDLHGVTFMADLKGKKASSAHFDGYNDWMELTAGLKEKEGTISFWIYPCMCKENNPIFVKKAPESDSFFGEYYVGFNEEGKVEAVCRGKWNVETGIVIEANKWRHVVVRWDDDSGVVDIFVNGKKILSQEYSVDPSALPDDATPAYLGKILHQPEAGGDIETIYYKGRLDEARLYNVWLPYDAVKRLYLDYVD